MCDCCHVPSSYLGSGHDTHTHTRTHSLSLSLSLCAGWMCATMVVHAMWWSLGEAYRGLWIASMSHRLWWSSFGLFLLINWCCRVTDLLGLLATVGQGIDDLIMGGGIAAVGLGLGWSSQIITIVGSGFDDWEKLTDALRALVYEIFLKFS